MLPFSHVRKRKAPTAGHTLMELMVVISLLAVAAALLLPITTRAFVRFRLRLTADSIIRLMQEARNRALFEGRTYFVVFPDSAARNRVLIIAREDGTSVAQYTLPLDISVGSQQEDGSWSNAIGCVAFYPDGTSDAIQLVLRTASNSVSGIQLDPLTAMARIVLPSEVQP